LPEKASGELNQWFVFNFEHSLMKVARRLFLKGFSPNNYPIENYNKGIIYSRVRKKFPTWSADH
jgi:hypothetical protein